jgi:DNA-binding NtrC family response regulator
MGMRVLLVEDDPIQKHDYIRILESFGCAVTAAETAENGIELSRSNSFHVILSDNILAGMSGLRSIFEYAKATNAPVLIMTSDFGAEIEKDALLLGAKRVFAKPLAWDAVVSELAGILPSRFDAGPPSTP